MDFTTLAKVEHENKLVLTTEQIAQFYECTTDNIKKNFNVNKDRFIEGKHYFKLEGEELKKLRVTFGDLQISPMTRTLYLWTKRGAALHAKMLSTDKAWEVYEMLEDAYFNAQEKTESAPNTQAAVAVQNQQPVLKSAILANVLKNAASIKQILEEKFNIKDGISSALAISMVEKSDGVELSEVKAVLPAATHEIGRFTPTQIAKKLGLKSAQVVNKLLIEFGLQEKDENTYTLTDEGKKYGEIIPFNNNKNEHSGYQIKWSAAVFSFFEEKGYTLK